MVPRTHSKPPGHLAWATDIHLDHINTTTGVRRLGEALSAPRDGVPPVAVLLTGDIANALRLVDELASLRRYIPPTIPAYFVLGNHDFYRGSIDAMRRIALEVEGYKYLPAIGPVLLAEDTILVGVDGWGDATYGTPDSSTVELNDCVLIAEIHHARKGGRAAMNRALRKLAREDAILLCDNLHRALIQSPRRIIVGTHVPPFREAAWHMGKPSDDQYAPYFSCKATGDVLLAVAARHSAVEFVVLCGHSHGGGTYQPLPNLVVYTGAAAYGSPMAQVPILLGW